MKKIILKKIVLTLVIAIAITSCNEDFLEQTNPNQITVDTYWKSLADLNSGLTAVYNQYKNPNILATVDESFRTDLCWPGFGRPTTVNTVYLQTFTNSDGTPNNKWSALYTGIFRANQVIEAYEILKPSLVSDADKLQGQKIVAQAIAFRGLFYFYLYNGFNKGAVPIFKTVPKTQEDFYESIRPATEVRAFFTADLEFAMANLPTSWDAPNKGRLTAGAAAAMLGQSYLYEAEYPKAAEYFKKVIMDYGYTLTPEIGSNFTTKDELNSESILEIQYSTLFPDSVYLTNNLNSLFADSAVGGFRTALPSCALIMAYKNDVMDMSDPRNTVLDPVTNLPRPRIHNLRASASLALVDDTDTKFYGSTAAAIGKFNGRETAYFRKYTNWDITTNEKLVFAGSVRSGVNLRVIRLADVYLMYAEALIKGGADESGLNEALLYVNKVRKRSALRLLGPIGSGDFPASDHDDVVYTAKSLMKHIMDVERFVELAMEGNAIRAIDLRRWNYTLQRLTDLSQRKYYAADFPAQTLPVVSPTKFGAILKDDGVRIDPLYDEFLMSARNFGVSKPYYWPIPNSEITANPKLFN